MVDCIFFKDTQRNNFNLSLELKQMQLHCTRGWHTWSCLIKSQREIFGTLPVWSPSNINPYNHQCKHNYFHSFHCSRFYSIFFLNGMARMLFFLTTITHKLMDSLLMILMHKIQGTWQVFFKLLIWKKSFIQKVQAVQEVLRTERLACVWEKETHLGKT